MTRRTGARLRNWVLQRGCAAHGRRRALHMYDMGHDTIRTRQHGWMAGNETRADAHGRGQEEKRASKPEDRLTPSRGWVQRTAIAISQAHPGTHEFERPR